MQTASTNGNANSTREVLDSVRQAVERLETELQKQQEEIKQLRAERDEYRKMLVHQVKDLVGDPKEWDNFDEKQYTLTVDDLLAVINSK